MIGSNILLLILNINEVIEDKTITYLVNFLWGFCGVRPSKYPYCGVNMWGIIFLTYSIFIIHQVRDLPPSFIKIKNKETI